MAVLDRYLKFAVQIGASDIHLTLEREPTIRLNGECSAFVSLRDSTAKLTTITPPALVTLMISGESSMNKL